MASIADLQTEREQLRANESKQNYEELFENTCSSADVINSAMQARALMLQLTERMGAQLLEAISGEFDETRLHYLMTDCTLDLMRALAGDVDTASLPLPEFSEYFKRGAKPRDLLTVSQWADRNRWLESGTNLPGRWNTSTVPYLREIMDSLSEHSPIRTVCFIKSSGVGGPLALDTPIATTKGWVSMGGITEQDVIFDENGKPCRVTYVSPVFDGRQCYDVEFSDGAVITCDDEHRWFVIDAYPGHAGKKQGVVRTGLVKTAHEIYKTFKHKDKNRYSIPVCGAIDLPDAALIIQPYVLGYWLANGNKSGNQMTAHEADVLEIAQHLTAAGHLAIARKMPWDKGRAANIILEKQKNKTGQCLRGHLLSEVGTRLNGRSIVCSECHRQHAMKSKYGKPMDAVIREEGFLTKIKLLGTDKEKNIPQQYLRASIKQRFELIQGLMDGDGSIGANGRCEYSTVSKKFAEQVMELLYGVGLKPVMYAVKRKAYSTSNKILNGSHYRLSFIAYANKPVFKLARKLSRQPLRANGNHTIVERRRIVNVKPAKSVAVRCIAVNSPSHLYLAGREMIATHNTEALYNWLGYVMQHLQNKDMLVVVPTLELRDRSFNPRLNKMLDETPALSDLVNKSSRSKTNRGDLMEYGARARVIKAGANSPDSLRSDHLPYVIGDEVDAFPWDVGGEGDPMTLIENRQRTFSRAKSFYVSTPTNDQASRIEQLYLRSDMRRYHVACPHCHEFQTLKFGGKDKPFGLKWRMKPAAENAPASIERVDYLCEHCGAMIDEGHKTDMLATGRWVAERPSFVANRGYHINALYAPTGLGLGWRAIVEKWLQSQNDTSELKAFINTYLGEVFKEQGDEIEATPLLMRREIYDGKPWLIITVGVDVQKDRIEFSVVGWGAGEEAWLIDHVILPGDTAQPHVWEELSETLKQWQFKICCIDYGYNATMVAEFVKKHSYAVAVKGIPGMARPLVEDEKKRRQRLRVKRKKGVPIEPLGVDQGKGIIYSRLKQTEAGAGYIHFPQTSSFDDEYFAQLTAEKLVPRSKGMRTFYEWVNTRPRNETLDCLNYALAGLKMLNIDWANLKKSTIYTQKKALEIRTSKPSTITKSEWASRL